MEGSRESYPLSPPIPPMKRKSLTKKPEVHILGTELIRGRCLNWTLDSPRGKKITDNGKRRYAMGDKGKKDKNKSQRQKTKKQEQEAKKKREKEPKRTS
jgi:hypothetical protein